MAKVIRCDRCGSIFEEDNEDSLLISWGDDEDDLCPGCTRDFNRFMLNRESVNPRNITLCASGKKGE